MLKVINPAAISAARLTTRPAIVMEIRPEKSTSITMRMTDAAIKTRAQELGAADIVAKPFSEPHMLELIKTHLGGGQ